MRAMIMILCLFGYFFCMSQFMKTDGDIFEQIIWMIGAVLCVIAPICELYKFYDWLKGVYDETREHD